MNKAIIRVHTGQSHHFNFNFLNVAKHSTVNCLPVVIENNLFSLISDAILDINEMY